MAGARSHAPVSVARSGVTQPRADRGERAWCADCRNGTRDIIEPGVTGLLSSSAEGFAEDVRTLRRDEALRVRLGAAARRKVESEFEAEVVVARVERLYLELVERP